MVEFVVVFLSFFLSFFPSFFFLVFLSLLFFSFCPCFLMKWCLCPGRHRVLRPFLLHHRWRGEGPDAQGSVQVRRLACLLCNIWESSSSSPSSFCPCGKTVKESTVLVLMASSCLGRHQNHWVFRCSLFWGLCEQSQMS